jgi:hypothetical protein
MSEYKVVTNNIYSIFLYFANSIIMNPSDISVQIRGIKLITFGFRFYQETSGFVISNIAVLMKTKNNYDIINRKINTKMNWIIKKEIMQKPVYSFCFRDQCESLRSKIFTETLKVFLLAEIVNMFKEIVELLRFLHRISLWV